MRTIKREEIVAAGERLVADGKDINGWSLRVACGGGKPERLLEVWQEHASEANPAAEPEPLASVTLPPKLEEMRDGMQAQLSAYVDGIVVTTWRQAEDIANRRTEEERTQARDTIARCERELADAKTVVDTLDTEVDDLGAKVGDLTQQLSDAHNEITRLTERLRSVEAVAGEAAKTAAATIADLTGKVQQGQSDVASARQEAATAKAVAEAAGKDTERLRLEGERLRQEGERTKDALQAAKITIVEGEAATKRHAELEAVARERVGRLETELDAVRSQLAVEAKKLVDEATARGSAEGKVATLSEQLAQAQAALRGSTE